MIENMKNLFRRASAGIRSEMCHPVKGYKVVLSDGWRNSKYEILNDEKHRVVVDGVEYQRIRALRRIERPFGLSPVEPGDLGGYVAMGYGFGDCLDNEGDCWVADGAFVSGQVSGDSQVTGNAHVGYPSKVTGKSLVSDFAQVVDGAEVNDSMVTGYAQVVGRNLEGLDEVPAIWERKQTCVENYSWISVRSRVSDGALISRFSRVSGSAIISGNVQLRKGAVVTGGVTLVSERGLVDLSGEVIDEPMNMWGHPTVLAVHEREDDVHSAKVFGGTDRGGVLPYWKEGYPRVVELAQEIADIYGVKLEADDAGPGMYASSFDKEASYLLPVHVSPATGIEYVYAPSREEYEA